MLHQLWINITVNSPAVSSDQKNSVRNYQTELHVEKLYTDINLAVDTQVKLNWFSVKNTSLYDLVTILYGKNLNDQESVTVLTEHRSIRSKTGVLYITCSGVSYDNPGPNDASRQLNSSLCSVFSSTLTIHVTSSYQYFAATFIKHGKRKRLPQI